MGKYPKNAYKALVQGNSIGLTTLTKALLKISPVAADTDRMLAAYELKDSSDAAAEITIRANNFLLDGECDVPRNITLTVGGTAADIAAVQATVKGVLMDGSIGTETMPAFTLNTAGSVVGSKIFKRFLEVTVPEMDGAGVTLDVGIGVKIGCPVIQVADVANTVYPPVQKAGSGTLTDEIHATDVNQSYVTLSVLDGTLHVIEVTIG